MRRNPSRFGHNRRHMLRRAHDRRNREQAFWAVSFLLFGLTMLPFGCFLLANAEAIALNTHDSSQLIGSLGCLSILSGFLALLAIPLQYALGD
jgi:hypothetical protein